MILPHVFYMFRVINSHVFRKLTTFPWWRSLDQIKLYFLVEQYPHRVNNVQSSPKIDDDIENKKFGKIIKIIIYKTDFGGILPVTWLISWVNHAT